MDLAKSPRAKMQKRVLVGGSARPSNYRGWFHGRNGAPSRAPKVALGNGGRGRGGGRGCGRVEREEKEKKEKEQGKEEKCRERSGDDGGGKDSLIFRSLSSAPTGRPAVYTGLCSACCKPLSPFLSFFHPPRRKVGSALIIVNQMREWCAPRRGGGEGGGGVVQARARRDYC